MDATKEEYKYQKEVDLLEKSNWTFKNAKTRYLTHNFHPYPAKFIPQIPRQLIKHLTKKGDTVFDPFCGIGTTLVEANLLGRNAIGTDINPVAYIVSKVKTTRLESEEVKEIEEIIKKVKNKNFKDIKLIQIPEIPNIFHWFQKDMTEEIRVLFSLIEQLGSEKSKNFCKCALSSILVKYSNQKGETTYSRTEKNLDSKDIHKSFILKCEDMLQRILEYQSRINDAKAEVFLDDARFLETVKTKVNLITTSPPYPNAFDYYLYHRHRIFWLGYDPKEMQKKEIGSHLNYQKNGSGILEFEEDMKKCFNKLYNLLYEEGYCCFVIGDSIFKGELVRNDLLIKNIAEDLGFVLEKNITREIHQTRRSFTSPARRAKKEHILIMRK